jgi:hypothetical protein
MKISSIRFCAEEKENMEMSRFNFRGIERYGAQAPEKPLSLLVVHCGMREATAQKSITLLRVRPHKITESHKSLKTGKHEACITNGFKNR